MQWTALEPATQKTLDQLHLFQIAKLTMDEKVLCVVRLEEGLFAISNTCPHAGAQLHHGACNKRGVVTCPLHGYKFDVRTGSSTDGNNYKISNYRFKTEEGILYIGSK